MKKLKEEDLAIKVLQHMKDEGWDCYPEAQLKYARGRADIAALKDDTFRIVEAKTSLSLQLLNQANEWIHMQGVDEVCVAVPNVRISRLVEEILRWKGIGLYHVIRGFNQRHQRFGVKEVQEIIAPRRLEVHKARRKRVIESLHPDMKNYKPGTTSGYSTPYNRTIKMILEYLKDHPESTLDDLVKLDHHYASKSSAKRSLTMALTSFEADKIESIKKGRSYVFSLLS